MKTQFPQQQADRYYREMVKEQAARKKPAAISRKKLSDALKKFRKKVTSED